MVSASGLTVIHQSRVDRHDKWVENKDRILRMQTLKEMIARQEQKCGTSRAPVFRTKSGSHLPTRTVTAFRDANAQQLEADIDGKRHSIVGVLWDQLKRHSVRFNLEKPEQLVGIRLASERSPLGGYRYVIER